MSSQQVDRVLAERYELRTPLGKGGMGTVWRAQDRLLKREVAVKEVGLPRNLETKEAEALMSRVMREARAAARLSHPGAVTIYDVVEEDGRPWIVMQLVEARTLEDAVMQDGPLSVEDAASLGLHLIEVLSLAHSSGIVHRDIKPANVMLPSGESAKLTDFGIATLQGDPKLTATGLVLGSPSYMAPEQAQHGTSAPETDIYSLGATLYFAVEGRPPFDKGQVIPTLTAVVSEEAPTPQRAGALTRVILDMLSKEPATRPVAETLRSRFEEVASASSMPPRLVEDRTTERVDQDPPGAIEETAQAPPERGTPVAPLGRERPSSAASAAASGGWRWLWVLGAVGALATLAVIGAGLLRDEGSGSALDTKKNDKGAQEEVTQEGSSSVPADWTSFENEQFGYTISHPEGWTTREASGAIDLVSPDAPGTYLRIGATDTPGDDVMARLQEVADGFSSGRSDYEEIALTETDYQGFEAGLWEYTYSEGDLDLHAYNLQFVTGEHGFALNFQTTEDRWADSQDEWEAFLSSFEPPA